MVGALAALTLCGCYEARIQWSPDGSRAAVITRRGLYLSTAEGQLSPMLLPSVRAVAWLPDGLHLVVASDSGRGQSLAIVPLEGGEPRLGASLYTGPSIADIRVSPSGQHVAFTAILDKHSPALKLYVAPLDGSAPAAMVADQVAAFPDWTADGRCLVFFHASGPDPKDPEEIRLGSLVEQPVVDVDGAVEIAPRPVHLAGVLFNEFARVRCLRDGRVLFTAPEVQLPFATADASDEREQLFAVDRARQSTLTRIVPRRSAELLPQGLSFFEVSPSQDRLLFGTLQGDVHLLTLATGEVEEIQAAAKDEMQGAPTWRPDGAFTYVRRNGLTQRPVEVVTRREEKETVLSAAWPRQVLEDLVDMSE